MSLSLVTGAAGFIGSHLCENLARNGERVRAFIHYNSRNYWGWLEKSDYRDQIEVMAGDLRDLDSVLHAVDGADRIYHLGALIGIPYSYESPLAYVRTNIEGTYNVLEAARRFGVGRILITSTSEVYGTALYIPIDEKHPLQPQSPYSASKIGADNLALSYHLSFDLPVVIARPFNTFGPRQSSRAIIPTIATQLLSGIREVSLGNLAPRRDLTYVEDTVEAMRLISRETQFVGKVVNIGSQQDISVGEIFEKLCTLLKCPATVCVQPERVRPDSSEVMRLLCDSNLLRAGTSWVPKYSLDEGLEKTVAWLKDHLMLYKHDTYNR
ncbi:MAG: GDP-mannose 4,6-dehydratase [Syntrophales bacterium]|jgi:dTDP-glucose 4,6-dehydratase